MAYDSARRSAPGALRSTLPPAACGYEQTTIADVTEEADVLLRTSYSSFRSKGDVLLADLDDRLRSLADLKIRQGQESLNRRGAAPWAAIVSAHVSDRKAAVRSRIINVCPALVGTGAVRVWAAKHQLTDRLRAAIPYELSASTAAIITDVFPHCTPPR